MLAAPTGRVDGCTGLGVRCPSRAARVAGEMGEGVRDDLAAGRMVWTVIRRVRRAALATGAVIAVVASMSAITVTSVADVQPGPSSQGTGALTHGKLVAGAGGTYLPIVPAGITP